MFKIIKVKKDNGEYKNKLIVNKRYKDIFDEYICNGESTPFTLGTVLVVVLCFLLLIIATFTQFNISHPWFSYETGKGFVYTIKTVAYNPQFPVIIFITYILYKSYSMFVYLLYLICGFFVYPIFAFGGGLQYIENYFFGYLLGFFFAILIAGKIFKDDNSIKSRLLGTVLGIISIHATGFIYCILLALFGAIDFNLIGPIVYVLTFERIIYDILFAGIILLIAPYIKNFLWIFMRPAIPRKKLKDTNKRNKVVGDNTYEHRQYNN